MLTEPEQFPDDISYIKNVLNDRGLSLSRKRIEEVWEVYSEGMSAGWINPIGAEDFIFEIYEPFVYTTF